MAASTRFLFCGVSLLIVLSQLVSVDAVEGLPTARIVSHIAGLLNNREALRQKRQSPSPQCLYALHQISQNPYFTTCSRIVQSINNVSSITPSQAQEFCDNHCAQVLINAYNTVLAACGSTYVPINKQVGQSLMLNSF